MFSRKHGWTDVDAHHQYVDAAQTARARRRQDDEHGRAQANAPETIPPTGRHHRADGR
ncbi:hypothetical protein ABZ949_02025 [Micromonospora tulbaghiae]|uniref:hypothetical protein n=1 Tax=Micromonospora tulbaghiae TaxID=479978 RepID=UPI0033DD143B